jgi:hypothetical protein
MASRSVSVQRRASFSLIPLYERAAASLCNGPRMKWKIMTRAENLSDPTKSADVRCPTVICKIVVLFLSLGEAAKFRDGFIHCPN